MVKKAWVKVDFGEKAGVDSNFNLPSYPIGKKAVFSHIYSICQLLITS
jgi:hypothetical protein